MNCTQFNEIVNELADYKPMAVTTRDAGVSHVALCADCAAKLSNARAVSGILLLAAGAESEDAPAAVKENLLAAFAAQQQSKPAPGRVVSIATHRKFGWWIAAASAVAAAVLFAVGLSIWRGGPSPQPQIAANGAGVESPKLTPTPNAAVPVSTPSESRTESPTELPKPIKPFESRVPIRPAGAGKQHVARGQNRRVAAGNTFETVARNTAPNEYVPLTFLAAATAIDTGTIVRVQLSRAALVRLGLPVSLEGADESVNAEVVLGDDGVARAIRLVQ